jgi:hypothetical protein
MQVPLQNNPLQKAFQHIAGDYTSSFGRLRPMPVTPYRANARPSRAPLFRASRPIRVTVVAALILCPSPGALGPVPAARAAPLCWHSYGCPFNRSRGRSRFPRSGCAVAMLTLLRLRLFFSKSGLLKTMIACTLPRPSRPSPAGAFRSLDRRDSACGADCVGSGGNVALVPPREMSGAAKQRRLSPTPILISLRTKRYNQVWPRFRKDCGRKRAGSERGVR